MVEMGTSHRPDQSRIKPYESWRNYLFGLFLGLAIDLNAASFSAPLANASRPPQATFSWPENRRHVGDFAAVYLAVKAKKRQDAPFRNAQISYLFQQGTGLPVEHAAQGGEPVGNKKLKRTVGRLLQLQFGGSCHRVPRAR